MSEPKPEPTTADADTTAPEDPTVLVRSTWEWGIKRECLLFQDGRTVHELIVWWECDCGHDDRAPITAAFGRPVVCAHCGYEVVLVEDPGNGHSVIEMQGFGREVQQRGRRDKPEGE